MCSKCVSKMSAYEMYRMIQSRKADLEGLKQSCQHARAELDTVIAEMTFQIASVDLARKANKLRTVVDDTLKEIKVIEMCSRDISGVQEVMRQRVERSQKKSFRDCVLQFISMKGGSPFEPTEVAKFVSDSRGQLMTNSVRVFTHRILRDLLLQQNVKQIAHGLYVAQAENAANNCESTESELVKN